MKHPYLYGYLAIGLGVALYNEVKENDKPGKLDIMPPGIKVLNFGLTTLLWPIAWMPPPSWMLKK